MELARELSAQAQPRGGAAAVIHRAVYDEAAEFVAAVRQGIVPGADAQDLSAAAHAHVRHLFGDLPSELLGGVGGALRACARASAARGAPAADGSAVA